MTIKEPAGRLARWALILQYYSFEKIHRKGAIHQNVDALRRPVNAAFSLLLAKEQPGIMQLSNVTREDPFGNEALLYFLKLYDL